MRKMMKTLMAGKASLGGSVFGFSHNSLDKCWPGERWLAECSEAHKSCYGSHGHMCDEAVLVVFVVPVVPCYVLCGAEGEHPHDTGAQPQAPHRHNVRILGEERLQILVVAFIVSVHLRA